MAKQATVPADISRGQHSGGDAATIPDGAVRRLRNLVFEDGSWVSRQAFTYDNLTNVRGLGLWYDDANKVARLIATDDNASVYKAYVKGTSGETWSADISSSDAIFGTITDSTSFYGKFFATSPSAVGGSTPLRMFYYDGTTWDRDANVPACFRPYSVATYNGRLFFGGANLVGLNFTDESSNVYAYSTAGWTLTAVTSATITANSTTLRRITPTNVTTASLQKQVPATFAETIGNGSISTVQFHCKLRGVDQSYAMPVTIQIKYVAARQDTYAYTAGQVVIPAAANGYRYRCTVAGTSAGAPPVYPTTVGTTVADNTVTWINDGSDVAAERPTTIPSLSERRDWTTTIVIATITDGAKTDVAVAIKFGTTAVPTYTLASLDFSYMDGPAVSNPLKQNYGQQVTRDAFEAPFFSNESAITQFTIDHSDRVYWSEVLDPLDIRATNFFRVADVPGPITGIRAGGDKLAVFKRRARWVFAPSGDANIVILPVGGVHRGDGALNPKAIGVSDLDGALYFIGENGFYRWDLSSDPKELCGQAMLRRVFNKAAASWVESQAAPANRALLTIDQENHRVHLYTQKGVIFIYDIRQETWSEMDAGGDTSVSPTGYQVCDMIYNPTTGNVYVAFSTAATGTAGLARLDDTQAASTDQISSSGTLPVYFDTWFRPIEGHPRADMAVDFLRAEIQCSVSGQSATAYVSMDQGATFTATSTPRDLATTPSNYGPERFVIAKAWGTIMPRLLVSGKAGTRAFRLSGVSFDIRTQKAPETQKR